MRLLSLLVLSCCFIKNTFCQSFEESLQKLVSGNDRYTTDQLEHPRRDTERREAIASSQSPFAIIVGCSDSRVAPEILFDQGIGDLFVVRVAGNVIGDIELDSVDFAAEYLGASLILVLGHENCGAVSAVLKGNTQGIQAIARLIEPAAIEAKKKHSPPLLDEAIHFNVDNMVALLKKSKVLSRLIAEKKIGVIGGYYNLESGKVSIHGN